MSRAEKIAVVVGCIVALGLAGWYYYPHQPMPIQPQPQNQLQRTISVGDATIYVDVVDTEVSREQGLSGRDGLAPNTGMLFVFDTDNKWGIWMKDMKFSIDIVWLTADGTVLTIKADASPSSYPQVFRPTKPARYVVELPAGFAAEHGIVEGSKFVL